MSDHKLRQILQDAIRDIDDGYLVVRRPRRWSVRKLVTPPLIAASLGLAGCGGRTIGTAGDATVPVDGTAEVDGVTADDAGPAVDAAYMAPFDAGPEPPYMAPFDGGVEPDYAAPFDAAVEDGGFVPLYRAPFPDEP